MSSHIAYLTTEIQRALHPKSLTAAIDAQNGYTKAIHKLEQAGYTVIKCKNQTGKVLRIEVDAWAELNYEKPINELLNYAYSVRQIDENLIEVK